MSVSRPDSAPLILLAAASIDHSSALSNRSIFESIVLADRATCHALVMDERSLRIRHHSPQRVCTTSLTTFSHTVPPLPTRIAQRTVLRLFSPQGLTRSTSTARTAGRPSRWRPSGAGAAASRRSRKSRSPPRSSHESAVSLARAPSASRASHAFDFYISGLKNSPVFSMT